MQGSKQLTDKLQDFNPNMPYVWQLRLTKAEYAEIAGIIAGKELDFNTQDDALLSLVYIAEWYKREYTNGNKDGYKIVFGDLMPDLEQIWNTLRIDQKYLYEGKSRKLWTYSTFILGGLAVKFELQKNEERFLKALCRLYNEQDITFENIANSNQSIAFRTSIESGHCLAEYFDAILQKDDDKLPFAKSDLADSTTGMHDLVETIHTINDEIQKSKFRIEWVFTKCDDVLVRSLRLWLNPEEKGKLHQILPCSRLKKWGIGTPENMRYVEIGIRYKKDNDIVENTDIAHSVLCFRNTGNPDVGFIAEVEHYKYIKRVPVEDFNKVEIVTWNEEGKEIIVQKEDIDFSRIQLYREEEGEERWTCRTQNQKDTALLFSNGWTLSKDSIDRNVEHLSLYNKKCGEGIAVNWCEIFTSVTIEKERKEGKDSQTFYNHIGHDYISTRTFDDTIQYLEGNKVALYEYDEEAGTNLFDTIPLIFSKEDIICHHCENTDDDNNIIEIIIPELLEYKTASGSFEPWTDESPVPYGKIRVRATIKDKQQTLDVFYAPGPITRDCDNRKIHYIDLLSREKVCHDESEEIDSAICNKKPLDPTTTIRLGNEYIYVEVEVYRPTTTKEVYYNGRLLKYDRDGKILIPYVIKNYITINDFSKYGFKRHELSRFRSIYHEINMPDYKCSGLYTDAIDGKIFKDDNFPKYIGVFLRDGYSGQPNKQYCYWDCSKNTKPQKVTNIKSFELPAGYVLFEDQRNGLDYASCEYIEKEDKKSNPIAKFKNKVQDKEVSLIEVFKVAVEYNQYFFYFKPLRNLALSLDREKDLSKFFVEIYNPLKDNSMGYLSNQDKEAMLRFADEFELGKLTEKLIREYIKNN